MTGYLFDHDRLDDYLLSIEYVADAFDASQSLEGRHCDPCRSAAQSIPLKIAERNGKLGQKDRARFLNIACGSALECVAIQGVFVVNGGIDGGASYERKSKMVRIVAMLARMAMKFDSVFE